MLGWIKRLFGGVSETDNTIVREFYTTVVNVSRRNADRTSRQTIISERVYSRMRLALLFEDDNPADRNAVAVFTSGGEQIGYLDRRLAADVRTWVAEGLRVLVVVKEITGGEPDMPTRGVNVLVTVRAAVVEK
jgi:HIRAN domain